LLVATLQQKTLCRGDGGFEAHPAASLPVERPRPSSVTAETEAKEAVPDHTVDLATSSQAALLYRQLSDPNPLHADPAVAKAAGFPRPILHGLCSYGIAGRAVVRACCNGSPNRLKR